MSRRIGFEESYVPEALTGCWLWVRSVMRLTGYGYMTKASTGERLAHRWSWKIHRGDPGTMMVLHRCDNRTCVNPDHLFLGTAGDNARDRVSKDRGVFKLTNARAKELIAQKGTVPAQEAATAFGVSASHVRDLWSGRHRRTLGECP